MELIAGSELREKLKRGDEFKLVMMLSALAYQTKHIPTSLHFETAEDMIDALDPGEEIIVYCADLHCAASIYAYRLLERHGYRHVRRYPGGLTDWEQAGYPLVRGSLEPTINRPLTERERALRPLQVSRHGLTPRPRRITPCGVAL
jgi:rhodanese-related sulfurtransferase